MSRRTEQHGKGRSSVIPANLYDSKSQGKRRLLTMLRTTEDGASIIHDSNSQASHVVDGDSEKFLAVGKVPHSDVLIGARHVEIIAATTTKSPT